MFIPDIARSAIVSYLNARQLLPCLSILFSTRDHSALYDDPSSDPVFRHYLRDPLILHPQESPVPATVQYPRLPLLMILLSMIFLTDRSRLSLPLYIIIHYYYSPTALSNIHFIFIMTMFKLV